MEKKLWPRTFDISISLSFFCHPGNRTAKLFSFGRTQKQQNSSSWGKKKFHVERAVGLLFLHGTTKLLIMPMC